MELTKRQKVLRRFEALKQERSSYMDHWRDLTNYIAPHSGRFLTSDANKGNKKHGNIINGTAQYAAGVNAAGMMGGITSPARPWFILGLPDAELAKYGPVRQWLYDTGERMRLFFSKSNFYASIHGAYLDLAVFGTASLFLEEDLQDGFRVYHEPVGSYALAASSRLSVDTRAREFQFTVAQLVQKFGLEKCSPRTRDLYKRGELHKAVEVLHLVEPQSAYEPGRGDKFGKPWRSCWAEKSVPDGAEGGFLDERGFEECPFVAPRWMVTGEDVYGSAPGMAVLGDTKALQLLERRKLQLVDKLSDPPMTGPAGLDQRASLAPGSYTPNESPGPGQRYEPALVINPSSVSVVGSEIREHERRVNQFFYADLWLMLANADRSNITAREVNERHEEKMLQLGPVYERLQDELLDPVVDRVFGLLSRLGQIPPPPKELQGMALKVEYVSIMAQAQKLLATTGIERLTSFVGSIAAASPDVLDNLDTDEVTRLYADAVGTPPSALRPKEQVEQLRAAKAEQAQLQKRAEAAMVAAQGAKTLSETDMEGDSALTRMLGGLGAPVPGVVQ